MTFSRIFLLFSLFSLAFSLETFDSHLLPRPLILEFAEASETQLREFDQEVEFQCTSWRFAVEANNLSPWKTIPVECADYVKAYVNGRGYALDLQRVSNEAGVYASSVKLNGDGKDVWIFDVDETLLSNLPYYADHGYGYAIFFPLLLFFYLRLHNFFFWPGTKSHGGAWIFIFRCLESTIDHVL